MVFNSLVKMNNKDWSKLLQIINPFWKGEKKRKGKVSDKFVLCMCDTARGRQTDSQRARETDRERKRDRQRAWGGGGRDGFTTK